MTSTRQLTLAADVRCELMMRMSVIKVLIGEVCRDRRVSKPLESFDRSLQDADW